MLKVLFFASLREQLGIDQLGLESARAATVAQLREILMADHPGWAQLLSQPQLMVAVNQTIAGNQTALQDGDEIAFFPPVTGG
ncbi:MAG: molybdopterin converting factor subunit 1 [Halomonadaceae bacterium]|nr:MAG: molybdopterin converting factor subunit 1 [Halomonadaceae bacterium]